MSIIIWCYLENNFSGNQTQNVKLDLDDKIPSLKNDQIVKSAFEYEISKLQTTGEEKITADKVSIDRSELEGMSSFFEKILANPLSVRKDFNPISSDIEKPIEVKDVKIAMNTKDDNDVMTSKDCQRNGIRNDSLPVDCQVPHANIHSIQKNLLETPVIPSVEKHLNNVKVTPSVPSPSRYGAIAALDMGDEQTEKERWADRTETITRLEHET